MKNVLAFDLGGTKVSVGIVTEKGKILRKETHPSLTQNGKEVLLHQLLELSKKFLELDPTIKKIGIASAGPVDPLAGCLYSPTNFRNQDGSFMGVIPIKKILEKKLKSKKVFLENDAAASLLAETWLGKAKKKKNVMIMTLGTGLGTAFLCNGKLVRAGRNQHTEAGHFILDCHDREWICGCGNYGCAESFLSGKNFEKRAQIKLKNKKLKNEMILENTFKNKKKYKKLFSNYSEMMAIALHNYVVAFCPELVLFSGSFSKAFPLFKKETETGLKHLLVSRNLHHNFTPKLQLSSLDNDAGLLGGAYVALNT